MNFTKRHFSRVFSFKNAQAAFIVKRLSLDLFRMFHLFFLTRRSLLVKKLKTHDKNKMSRTCVFQKKIFQDLYNSLPWRILSSLLLFKKCICSYMSWLRLPEMSSMKFYIFLSPKNLLEEKNCFFYIYWEFNGFLACL